MAVPAGGNMIRRSLKMIIDKDLTDKEKDAIWKEFNNRCAFCGNTLSRDKREGHIDHLIPDANWGLNWKGNRVLSCSSCNGDKKREGLWRQFLRQEYPAYAEQRIAKIVAWQKKCGPEPDSVVRALKKIKPIINFVQECYWEAANKVRAEARRQARC